MADSSRHRGAWRRVASLAALGLLAGTTWSLLAHTGSSAPASVARTVRQHGRMLPQDHHARGSPRHRARSGPRRAVPHVPPHPQAHGRRARPTSAKSPTPRATKTLMPGATLRHASAARAAAPQRTAAPQPALPRPGVPVRLRIPALGLKTSIEPVGLKAGAMDVPSNAWDVGWYRLGPRPGAVGNAVIDGHLDTATGPAIFLNLHNLRVGDRIYVTDQAGIERGFVVTEMHSYPLTDAPLARIFGPTSGRHLNLITCSGTWQAWEHLYDQRLVVYTRLLASP